LGPAPGHGPGSGSGPAAAVGAMTPGSAPSATPVTPASAAPSAPASHTGTNLYACRDCGRSYSRPEHLVRHVQTHTLGRRFVCDICQKSFARKDLLRRHVTNHDSDSSKKRRRNNAAGTASSPGAGRVSHACRPCAAARVKCDDEKPCKRCVSRKLTCVSSASETSSSAAVHHHRQSYLQPSSSTSPPTGEPSIASSGAAGATAPYHQQNQHQHHRASAGASNDGDRSVATSRDDSQSPASFTTTHQPRSLPAHVAAPASALPPSSLSAPPLASAASRDRDGQYPSLYSYRMPSRPDDSQFLLAPTPFGTKACFARAKSEIPCERTWWRSSAEPAGGGQRAQSPSGAEPEANFVVVYRNFRSPSAHPRAMRERHGPESPALCRLLAPCPS
jgi:hypothetical protein